MPYHNSREPVDRDHASPRRGDISIAFFATARAICRQWKLLKAFDVFDVFSVTVVDVWGEHVS